MFINIIGLSNIHVAAEEAFQGIFCLCLDSKYPPCKGLPPALMINPTPSYKNILTVMIAALVQF